MAVSRRTIIGVMGAGALLSTIARAAQRLRPTPQETLGPFFPMRIPEDHDADLTRIAGKNGVAKGQVITLSGQVLFPDGSPVSGAELKIWQANSAGRYANPIDTNPAPLDADFEGVALFNCDQAGRYSIRSIKPGPYPTPAGDMRAPHIHFDVSSKDYRLVTQMYFPDEPLNPTDLLFRTMPGRGRDPALAICKSVESRTQGTLAFYWDIVLLQA